MSLFSIEVRTEAAERKFDLSAGSLEDLSGPMTRFGAYLRAKALERYKAQDFAPLAPATIEKRAQKGLRSLERKLSGDVRRAMKRARKARGGGAGLLERLMTSTTLRRAAEDALSSQTRGVRNRQAALAAFQAEHRKGMKERVQGPALALNQRISLIQREARAVARAVGQPILGGLPRTVMFSVSGASMSLTSKTHQSFSETHNQGGGVGHGAQVPERETLALEPVDIEVLQSILKDAALLPFQEGLQGPGY